MSSSGQRASSYGFPKQDNQDDCGVFTAVYADYMARSVPMLFSAADVPMLRLKLAGEIASGQVGVWQQLKAAAKSGSTWFDTTNRAQIFTGYPTAHNMSLPMLVFNWRQRRTQQEGEGERDNRLVVPLWCCFDSTNMYNISGRCGAVTHMYLY